MTFKKVAKVFSDAVNRTPCLEKTLMPGLGALRAVDRPHIQAENTRMLLGSVDIDRALMPMEPNANRWDFAIGYKHSNREEAVVYWVEIHTGSDTEFKLVLRKLDWLLGWLRSTGKALNAFECEYIWVASGATAFTDSAKQTKIMAQRGLRYAGKRLFIPDERVT